jgi:hypothetical protein
VSAAAAQKFAAEKPFRPAGTAGGTKKTMPELDFSRRALKMARKIPKLI